jgi:uncharacterized RDD family membrane protein YckC
MQEDTLTIRSAYGFEYSMAVAGLGSRAYAFAIDWHIRILAAMAWVLIAWLLVYLLDLVEMGSSAYNWLLFLPAGAIYFLYHPVLELMMQGNSPGKRYAKIKVVTVDGGIPAASAILVRNVMRVLDSLPSFYMIGVLVCVFTRHQVRIGDLAAGTLLVYEQAETSASDAAAEQESTGVSIREREVLQKLLDRWDDLTPEHRGKLGGKALEKFGRPSNVPDLRAEIQAILNR